MTPDEIISWLLEGDVSIQYQTHRDLLGVDKIDLNNKIEMEGWGKLLLSMQQKNGHWGQAFYQPKWTSTHYTLLDLKNLNISPANKQIREAIKMVLTREKAKDGGVLPIGTSKKSDVCINGMLLNYSCYFGTSEEPLKSIVDFLLNEQMEDGGFNCHSNRKGASHSSLHTTLSVLEGILEYEKNGYRYRLKELQKVRNESREFILMHRLFRSDKTGNIINKNFLRFYYPCRWYYDILRTMDYYQCAHVDYDERMSDALSLIRDKRTKEGQWKLPSKHPGATHFDMEQAGKPSRWNTLRALRVLKRYG